MTCTAIRPATAAAALLGAAVLASFTTMAQSPSPAAVVLTNVRVIDGSGRAPIEKAALVIANGRVSSVGPEAFAQIPAGATRIDLNGKTVMPGMVNAHGHVQVDRGSRRPVRDELLLGLRTYASYGITSVVSLGSTEADELEGLRLQAEQDQPGLDRARVFTAGLNAEGKTPDEARKSVDRLAGLNVHVIKFHIDGTPNDMNTETWSAIIDESHAKKLKAAVHIFYLKDAQNAVDHGVDVLAHSVRDQNVTQALIASMKQKNVGYIPTLTREVSVFAYETTPAFFKDPFFMRGMPLYRETVDRLSDPAAQAKVRQNPQTQAIKKALEQANRNLKTLSDAGIQIALGTDSGAGGGRWQGYFEQVELEMMVKAGLTPMQALVAATGNAAKMLGLRQLGTLEAGNWADFVVLSANPLDNILNTRRIESVWIAGRRVPGVEPVTQTQ